VWRRQRRLHATDSSVEKSLESGFSAWGANPGYSSGFRLCFDSATEAGIGFDSPFTGNEWKHGEPRGGLGLCERSSADVKLGALRSRPLRIAGHFGLVSPSHHRFGSGHAGSPYGGVGLGWHLVRSWSSSDDQGHDAGWIHRRCALSGADTKWSAAWQDPVSAGWKQVGRTWSASVVQRFPFILFGETQLPRGQCGVCVRYLSALGRTGRRCGVVEVRCFGAVLEHHPVEDSHQASGPRLGWLQRPRSSRCGALSILRTREPAIRRWKVTLPSSSSPWSFFGASRRRLQVVFG
jgi:hypothetical protein